MAVAVDPAACFGFFCDFFFRQIEFTTLDFTLPDAKQVIFDPMSAHDPLGVSSLQEVGVHFLQKAQVGALERASPL